MKTTMTLAYEWKQSESKFKQKMAKSYYEGKFSTRAVMFLYLARKSIGLIFASIGLIAFCIIHYLYF